MSAREKMSEIIDYISHKFPGIVIDKKWNRLLREMSNEIEILENTTVDPPPARLDGEE